MPNGSNFLRYIPPMGIYETLYAFWAAFGTYMGEPGTHPWSQGFPRTDQLPGGPEIPTAVQIPATDLKYPKAWGLPELRQAIASYYNTHYGANLSMDNVMVFAGGRPALIATLLFLAPDIQIRIAETEYTPYYDMLERLNKNYTLVPSSVENMFRPSLQEYIGQGDQRRLVLLSNPCNPTGITRHDNDLARLVQASTQENVGLLVDEAYELFHESPVSALQFVDDIDNCNLIVLGAATKGLQAPGIRIGWAVTSKVNIEILGNFSSFGMGGVSHPSQRVALALLDPDRVRLARTAVPQFYKAQRDRYGEAFARLGIDTFSGSGGFYHWCRLPNGMSAQTFNERLFSEGAAILKGTDCDMARRGEHSPLQNFFRFSFGPLKPDSFDADMAILKKVWAK